MGAALPFDESKFPEPRPFQVTARDALRQGYADGHINQVVMAPTGSGKTIFAMFLIKECLKKGKRPLFLADRRTLINQTSEVADSLGLTTHGVLMANHWRFNPSHPFQIASAQTIAQRGWPECDLVIIDECHTQLRVWCDHIRDTRVSHIGLSATPFSVGMKADDRFTHLINATTMADLTEQKILVPMRVYSCTKVNMKGAKTVGGEWTDAEAGSRGMEIIGDVVAEWLKFGENRKTIVFGSTIAHCDSLVKSFNENGVMAAGYTSETKEAERKEILDEFKLTDSPLKVLISVEALAKGFDQKDVSCICDVRPLRKSLSTAIQMWGRGLRSSPNTGKQDCILLDFSGNIVRFNEDYEQIYHCGLDELDDGEKLDKKIRKDNDDEEPIYSPCPKCGHKPFIKRCVSCGHEKIVDSLIEHESGEMVEFKVGKISIGTKLEVWEQCVTLEKANKNPEKAKGRAANLYRSIVGVWPRGLPEFDATQFRCPSKAIINKQKSNRIAYFNAVGGASR